MTDDNPAPGNNTALPTAIVSLLNQLSDIQVDVIRHHALAQGASVIYAAVCAPRSEASNALHSQLEIIIEHFDRLCTELHRLEQGLLQCNAEAKALVGAT